MSETTIRGNHLTLSEARDRQSEGVEEARQSVPESERGEVPVGGVNAVKAWVGDDQGKAQRALDAEYERTEGVRDGLVTWLEGKGAVAPGE